MRCKKYYSKIITFLLIVIIFFSEFQTINTVFASEFSFYNHNTKSNTKYTGKQISYFYNNKKIDLSYPGILMSGTALADYEELFVQGLGLSAQLDNKQITITDGETKLVLTVGSKTVKVNEKSQKMSVAPAKLEFDDGTIKYYVPTRFVAETFGYNYLWDSTNNEARITKTFRFVINGKTILYNDSLFSASYLEENISLDTPIIRYKQTVYAPAKQLFHVLGCEYQEKQESISVTKDNITLNMQLGSGFLSINELPFEMDAAPICITDPETAEDIIYIPIEFCVNMLGYKVLYNDNSFSYSIQKTEYTGNHKLHPELMMYYQVNKIPVDPTPVKTYFSWSSEENTKISGVKNLSKVNAYSIENADVLELYGITRDDVNDFIDSRILVLELPNVITNMDTKFYADFDVPHINYVLLTTINNNSKMFIMAPIEDCWEFEETEECLRIYFMSADLSLEDIKIYKEEPVAVKQLNQEVQYPDNHLIIPVPEGFDTSKIKVQDNYLDLNLEIILPGNLVDFYKHNTLTNPYDFVKNIKIVYDAKTNQTIVTCYTEDVCGYEELYDNKFFALYLDKPSNIYNKIIVLDAGHGGKDPGAVSENNLYEKNVTLKIINYTNELFNNCDIKVYCTRTTDKYITLQDRAGFAKKVNADMFISLHLNSSEYKSAQGTEVYYCKANNAATKYGLTSNKMAKILANNLYVAMDTKLRGVINNDYYVVKYNSVPAVLIELGFMSNNEDRAKLVDKLYQQKAAKAIYESVIEIFSAYPTGR